MESKANMVNMSSAVVSVAPAPWNEDKVEDIKSKVKATIEEEIHKQFQREISKEINRAKKLGIVQSGKDLLTVTSPEKLQELGLLTEK